MKKKSDLLLKICGMRDGDNIREVAAWAPDYMGFIFYPHSPRYVGNEFQIPDHFPEQIKKVGVFVNEQISEILKMAAVHKLDYIQLHGDEPVEQCETLKNAKMKVIKAFSVDEYFDFRKVIPFKKSVSYFLFDSKSESRGGSGKAFDWRILGSYDQDIPFFLSGGVSAENIGNVILLKDMNLHALDVNSKVETEPGMKSISRVSELINEMHRL